MVVAGPAFAALTELGKRAAGARPALEALATGADAWMAIHAHRALMGFGDDPTKHVPFILEGLLVKDPVASAASILLQDLGAVARPFVDAAATSGKNAALRKVAERLRSKLTAKSRR